MLIAQMTDIHIGFDQGQGENEMNYRRFRATLGRLIEQPSTPDMLLLTGDLTERGDDESYALLAMALGDCRFPVHVMPGNHDDRRALRAAFPATPTDGAFQHYVIESHGLLIICLDTLEPGRHGGAFCEARAAWLSNQLAAQPGTPTVIFMHHPPVVSGIDWMDPSPDEAWIKRFGDCVAGQDQILSIHCGHLHRPVATRFRRIPLTVTASVAPLVAMDLRDIDPEDPDNRALITTEPPRYALHRWDGEALVSHHETVGDWGVLESYRPKLQPMIRAAFRERNSD